MHKSIDAASSQTTLVYLTTKFPVLSETFIYEEILALEAMDIRVRFFVFQNTQSTIKHRYIAKLNQLVTYAPELLSRTSFAAHARMLTRHPRQYLRTLGQVIFTEWKHPLLVLKNLYAFGKGVALAHILETDGDLPHHIHAQWATMPTTAALTISQLLDIPFSFTAHAWDIYKEPLSLCLKLREAQFAVTISDYNCNYLQALCPDLPPDKVHVVRCGIDLDKFPYQHREDQPTDTPLIISVGRLVPKKGLKWLIEACALLKQQGRDFRCNIVGGGPLMETLNRQIQEHGLQNEVSLLGGMPQEELVPLWQKATVFALPCVINKDGNQDGIPVVLMETLATGIPAVSTQVSGIPELIEHNVTGLLVPPEDASALATSIAQLFDDPALRKRLSVAGRQRVEQSYAIGTNTRAKTQLLVQEPRGGASCS